MPTLTNNSDKQSAISKEKSTLQVSKQLTKSQLILTSTNQEIPIDPLEPLAHKMFEQLAPERRTPEIDAAFELYFLGLNVFPQPPYQKGGWPWKPLQYTRVHPMLLAVLFENYCNLAVMTGRTSGNLFVLDCESKETFEKQGELLRKHNIPIYSVLTNGERDGGHYYFRCRNGEVQNIRSKDLPDLEIRGERCYVLAPPSVHPTTGVLYQWHERQTPLPPIVDISQLGWLHLKLATRQPLHKVVYDVLSSNDELLINLSRDTLRFIYSGAPVGMRNNKLFSAACDMIGNNIDDQAIENLLGTAAERSGLDFREIRTTLKSAHSRHREPARKSTPTPKGPEQWELALEWAQNHKWAGRTGQSDRATFIAMCERAKLYSSERGTFRASSREVAELAQLRRATVSKCIGRLLAAGHILGSGIDEDTRARLFRFPSFSDELWRKRTIVYPWSSHQWYAYATISPQNRFAKNDAFERNALGKTAKLVWQGMSAMQKAMKPKMIAEACNLSAYQVYRALKKLQQYNMVSKQKRGWVAVSVTAEWLDENVATVAGTRGRMKARKEKHQIERAIHAGWDVMDLRGVQERKYYAELVKNIQEGK
jgi:hypothetical protein